jgi:isoquinoline 1-oxidoreductase subunit alpha
VTTIEATDCDVANAVRTSWLALDATECAYCQPGEIIAATALLKH